jgi:hypothetical protein
MIISESPGKVNPQGGKVGKEGAESPRKSSPQATGSREHTVAGFGRHRQLLIERTPVGQAGGSWVLWEVRSCPAAVVELKDDSPEPGGANPGPGRANDYYQAKCRSDTFPAAV